MGLEPVDGLELGDGDVLKSEGKAEGDCSLDPGCTSGADGKTAPVIPANANMNNPAHEIKNVFLIFRLLHFFA